MQNTAVFHRYFCHRRTAAIQCTAKAVLTAVGEDAADERRRDQDGMPALPIADRTGERRVTLQKQLQRCCREEGNIHRGEEKPVALVLQIREADAGRLKHLGMLIVLVPEKDDPQTGQMPFQLDGVVSRDHHDLFHAGLLQRGHHALGDGDGADVQHRFEVSHARAHSRRDDQRRCLHTIRSFRSRL